MVNEAKTAGAASAAAGGGGFRAKMTHYLYSGEPRHVFGGILIVSALFGVPYYYMTRGVKHKSHQDMMDKADRARNARLSRSAAAEVSTGN